MARAASPFYYGNDAALGAAVGQSLGRALFGDPEAAQQLALRRAQMDTYDANARESRAHAGLYDAQTEGVGIQNKASAGLPDLIAGMFTPPAPQTHEVAPGISVQGAAPGAPPAAPVFTPEAFRSGLPSLMAAMAQMQGDKVDPNKVIGGLAAMFGNDEFARRGMVGNGTTPGENFALTPERADDIRKQGNDAAYRKDTAVATINHANDIAVAHANHANDIAVARANHENDIPVAEIAHDGGGGRHVALEGFNPGGINDGAFAKSMPGYAGSNGRYAAFKTIEDGENAQKELLRRYIRGGFNTPQKIADKWAPAADGNDPVTYATTIAKQLGVGVNDRLSEADVDRFQLAQGRAENAAYRGKGKPAKVATVKKEDVSASDVETIGKMIDKLIPTMDLKGGHVTERARQTMISNAIIRYQGSGNIAQAVQRTIDGVQRNLNGGGQPKAQASAEQPPVPGARKAPDGKWYVKQGKGYARVDVGR